MDKNWNDIKEGNIIYLAVVFIDMVGSTNLYKEVDQEEAEKRTNFFQVMAEDNFLKYGGLMGAWHGDDCPIFFREEVSAFKASINFINDIRTKGIERGIEAEIAARISISSGLVEFKKEVGKMNAQFISFGGHLNSDSACPENSILITEDVYDNLPDDLKVKFNICGTTQRDKIISFIYPKEKKTKKDPEKFLPDAEDPADALRTYLDTIKGQCKTLLFSGIPQSSKIPLLQLTESFFPLKVRKREEKKVERWRKEDEKATSLMFETTYSEAAPCPFIEIFKKERQIIVLGDPGSGKTTLLRWLCLIHSQGTKVISDKGLGDEVRMPQVS